MPRKLAGGHKLRSIFETEKTSTDPVCPNQPDDFQTRSNWPVRQKAVPIKRISLKQKKSSIEQSKENGDVKSSNDEIKTVEKSADVRKHCVKKVSEKSPDVPKNNSEKCVDKMNENKKLSAVTQQLLNKCVNLIGAEKLYECLKQAVDQPKTFKEQVEVCIPIKSGKAMESEKILNKTKNSKSPIVAEVAGKCPKENSKNSFESKKNNEKAKPKANAESLEKSKLKQGNESKFFQSTKRIHSDLDDQVKDQNTLQETENGKSFKKELEKFVERQQNYSLVLKELADCCGEVSDRMIFIEDKFEKLQSPLYKKKPVYNDWKEFLLDEFKSMTKNLHSLKNTADQYRDILQLITLLLTFLSKTKSYILCQHFSGEVHDSEYNMVKSFKDIVDRLHYFGVLLSITKCTLMKLLVVKRLNVARKSGQYWMKIGDRLRLNFDEEIFIHDSAAFRDSDIHELAERVEKFIQASALKVLS